MPQPPQTRRQFVAASIRRKIQSRALLPGDRLPSIRGFAAQLQVSPSTVVEAYDGLVAEGVIQARRGSGFFVADAAQPFAVREVGPALEREVDPLWVARQSIDTGHEVLKPGCGWMPADWMPTGAIRKALRGLAKADDPVLTHYGGARGAQGLRRFLARRLQDQGVQAGPEHVLLTGSGSQSLDLICRLLLRPGDTVLVDDPCYFNFQALLRAHQIEIASVPYTRDGPDLERFEAVLCSRKPRLYLTNSALHNPTGVTLSAQVAHRVLSLAQAHDLLVVEDDIFAEFEPELSPRLAALDGLNRVLRIGSFSKTVSASLRCGYIAARGDWIEQLIDLQVATNFGGPSPMVAETIHAVLTDGAYRKHMVGLLDRLTRARRHAISHLEPLGIRPWVLPRGGFYLWATLPGGVEAAHLARLALSHELVLAPGNVFSAAQTCPGFMRFNVSQMTDPACYEILSRVLGEAHRDTATTGGA